jgi:hypothetical protein
VLSEMLAEAVRLGVIATNPAAAVRPPRAPRPALHVPEAETCTAILERVRGREVEGPVVLALETGIRLGEILAVRWKDVDLERKVLRVTATLSYVAGEFTFPQPKTSCARRSVDLPAFAVAFLRRQRKAQLERRLFYGETWTDYDVVLDEWPPVGTGGVRGGCPHGLPSPSDAALDPDWNVRRAGGEPIVCADRPPNDQGPHHTQGRRPIAREPRRTHCGHLRPPHPTVVSRIERSTVLALPVTVPSKLRVRTAQTEHTPIYLRRFFRVLSSWVHAIYQRKRLPRETEEGVVVARLWPALPEQLIGGIGGRSSHRWDHGRVHVHGERDGGVPEPLGYGLRVNAGGEQLRRVSVA